MTIKSKASERASGLNLVQDVDALSRKARQKVVTGATGNFTINSTVKTSLGPLGFPGTLLGGYLSFTTLPVGGALTVQIVAYDSDGNAEVVLTEALDAEAGTVREGAAFELASTNVALLAADTIEIHTIADNNTVSTQQVGGRVTLLFDPAEDSIIDF